MIMKKMIAVFVLCAFAYSLSLGQTSKGRVLLGVSSNFSIPGIGNEITGSGSNLLTIGHTTVKSKSDSFDDSDPTKITGLNLLPKIGFFVIDNLAVGLDINLATTTSKSGSSDDKYTMSLLSAGPFVRYYIPSENVLPFFEAGGSFGAITTKYKSGGNESKDKSGANTFWGGVGLAVPVGDRVTFDVLAGYNSLTIKDKEDNDDNYRTIVGTLGIKIGVIVFLGSIE